MAFWKKLFGEKEESGLDNSAPVVEPVREGNNTGAGKSTTFDLGWYWSDNKDEYQMARIEERDRATHFYVIGATGTGKTKFLEFLIQQDIQKGNGFGVIDPHGDLIEDIKGLLILHYTHKGKTAEEIMNRVVLIDPTDPEMTVTFNPIEAMPGVSMAEQANELIGSFRKIWSDSWGVRMEDLMRNSLIALGEAELTLTELSLFLTNRAFRKAVLTKVSHPIAKDYFQRFETMTDRAQITWIEPVMNKINAFFSDDRIREMFSSPHGSFSIRRIMDEKKMLLIKLDKGKLGDSSDLLGSLLMAKIQVAAFSRSDVPKHKRVPFYMYIDEFQNFASDSFATILSEARKYGLSLIMAHQTLAQISPELKSLILGNAGIQVFFRINRQDATLLAKEAFEYSGREVKSVGLKSRSYWSLGEEWEHHTEALQSLPPRCCYAKHKIEGGVIPIQTEDMDPVAEILGVDEDEYHEFLKRIPFGLDYLQPREDLRVDELIRTDLLVYKLTGRKEDQEEQKEPSGQVVAETAVAAEESKVVEMKPRPAKARVERKERKAIPSVSSQVLSESDDVQPAEEKGQRQHQYLKSLIKRVAEEKGFRAILEQPTPDGQGRVDVSLERDGKRIACEISVTSTSEQELGNIRKCLIAGYETVILCSAEKRNLTKVKGLVEEKLKSEEQQKILFFQPDDLLFYLQQQAASSAGKEERIKGYKVKVQYQAVKQNDEKARREAVGQVIFDALKRMGKER